MKLFEWEKFECSREWEEKLQIVFFIPLTVLTSFGYQSRLRSERRPKWNYLLITLDSRLLFLCWCPTGEHYLSAKKEQSDIVVIIKIIHEWKLRSYLAGREKKKHVVARKFKFSWDSPEGCRAIQQQTCRCREREFTCNWAAVGSDGNFPLFLFSLLNFTLQNFSIASPARLDGVPARNVFLLWSAFICSSHPIVKLTTIAQSTCDLSFPFLKLSLPPPEK